MRLRHGEQTLLTEARRMALRAALVATSAPSMQTLRDNPRCADEEYARDRATPRTRASSPKLTFDPQEDVAAPYIAKGARPRVAVLREQGVNGQVEMAAAFDARRLRRRSTCT